MRGWNLELGSPAPRLNATWLTHCHHVLVRYLVLLVVVLVGINAALYLRYLVL
jgi:hypothetical protein